MRILVLFLALFWAAPAFATAGFTDCQGNSKSDVKVSKNELLCWEFLQADSTHQSTKFVIQSESALICHDPDTAAAGVPGDGSQVVVMHCPARVVPSTENVECDFIRALAGTSMTGLGGTNTTQNRCVRVARGVYYLDITTTAPATDTSRTAIQGE